MAFPEFIVDETGDHKLAKSYAKEDLNGKIYGLFWKNGGIVNPFANSTYGKDAFADESHRMTRPDQLGR